MRPAEQRKKYKYNKISAPMKLCSSKFRIEFLLKDIMGIAQPNNDLLT